MPRPSGQPRLTPRRVARRSQIPLNRHAVASPAARPCCPRPSLDDCHYMLGGSARLPWQEWPQTRPGFNSARIWRRRRPALATHYRAGGVGRLCGACTDDARIILWAPPRTGLARTPGGESRTAGRLRPPDILRRAARHTVTAPRMERITRIIEGAPLQALGRMRPIGRSPKSALRPGRNAAGRSCCRSPAGIP